MPSHECTGGLPTTGIKSFKMGQENCRIYLNNINTEKTYFHIICHRPFQNKILALLLELFNYSGNYILHDVGITI